MTLKLKLATFAAASAIALASPAVQAATPADTLVVGRAIDSVKSFDPAVFSEYAGAEVIASLYDRLFQFYADDMTKLTGGLCESWQVSGDGLTFTFRMRQGVQFQSGNPVTAEDAVYSLTRVAKIGQLPGQILGQLGITKDNVTERIKAVSPNEFTIAFEKPYSADLVMRVLSAGLGSVVDSQVLKKNEVEGDYGQKHLVSNSAGAGAFVLRSWQPGQTIVIEANKNYWRSAPKINRIMFRHVAEPASQRLLLERGDIDMARDLAADQLKALASNAELRVDNFQRSGLNYLVMNLAHEHLGKPKVQEAIRYLIDYDGMVDSFLNGQRIVHQSFWPRGLPHASSETPYKLDVERAKKLLAEAGLAEGFDVKLLVINRFPYPEIAQSLQSTMAQANIRVEVQKADPLTVFGRNRARQHEMSMLDWSAAYPDIHVNANWFVIGDPNVQDDKARLQTVSWRNRYYNKEISELSLSAVLMKDAEKRQEAYGRVQKAFQQEYPTIVMFQYIDQVAQRKNVKGFAMGVSFDAVSFERVTK